MSKAYPHFIRASLVASLVPALVILICLISLNIVNQRDTMVPKMMLSVMFYGALFYIAPMLSLALIIYYYLLKLIHRLSFLFAYLLSLLLFLVFLGIRIISNTSDPDEFLISFIAFSIISCITFIVWFWLARARNMPQPTNSSI